MNSNLLQREQTENILQAINLAVPNNEHIQKELSKYTRSKDTFIRRLQEQWYGRDLPIYTELQVRQMNSAHYSDKTNNQVINDIQGRDTGDMDSKSWIVKSTTRWSGWNASENTYYDTPLLFEGVLILRRTFNLSSYRMQAPGR